MDFEFCVSGKNSSLNELIDITRIYEQDSTPSTDKNFTTNETIPPPPPPLPVTPVFIDPDICVK